MYEETVEELLMYKVAKTAEEKSLKNKQKKLDKKLKVIEEKGAEKQQKSLELDSNENISNNEAIHPVPDIVFGVPVQNNFDVFTNLEGEDSENLNEETVEHLMQKEEEDIRAQLFISVKTKVAIKLEHYE